MGKLKNPLFSFDARGTIGRAITYAKRRGRNIAESVPFPTNANTPPQKAWRPMFSKCIDLWHLLSVADKLAWESAARPLHMTGYAWFISQCLRPNPGIYLPLAGGTMTGDIDLSTHRIIDLPAPVDPGDATRKSYVDAIPGGYTEGCRCRNTSDFDTVTSVIYELPFTVEDYDTDGIHDNLVNPDRLTCRTAGIYHIFGQFAFDTNANGIRVLRLTRNLDYIGYDVVFTPTAGFMSTLSVSTILNLSVNDYIRLSAQQVSGGNLLVRSVPIWTPVFGMQRIG